VPGVIAAVVSQLVMGRQSISIYQGTPRRGHLEGRLALPLTAAVQGDTPTVPSELTLDEVVDGHLLATRHTSVAVVDGARFVGMLSLTDLADTPRPDWSTTRVADVVAPDPPRAQVGWSIEDAVRLMDEADTDVLAVVDPQDRFVGLVTTADLVRLDQILGTAEGLDRPAGEDRP